MKHENHNEYSHTYLSAQDAPRVPTPQRQASGSRRSFFRRLYQWVFVAEQEPVYGEPPPRPAEAAPVPVHEPLQAQQIAQIQQALKDWKSSTKYFESVSDPELVDYAVFEMEAAQKRYMYLLRSARMQAMQAKGSNINPAAQAYDEAYEETRPLTF